MILNQCNFFSKTLSGHVDVDLLLPGPSDSDCLGLPLDGIHRKRAPAPVLYLLHGALDDRTSWLRRTQIERCAERAGFAVVMPSAQNSFYANAGGLNYFDFITAELPLFVAANFPVSTAPQDSFIAGVSMGGYGAARAALTLPQRYAAFGCISGAIDPAALGAQVAALGYNFFDWQRLFGGLDKIAGSGADLYTLAAGLAGAAHRPAAYLCCAQEDEINRGMTVRLAQQLRAGGVPVTLKDGHGGHDWDYWDGCLGDFVAFAAALRAEARQ